MKSEIRLLGIDDAPFDFGDKTTLIIGTFFRGGDFMDGVLSTEVEVDGDDATLKLMEMINHSKFKPQVQAILLDGIAVGGFNIINIDGLSKYTRIPVIVVVRHMPDFEKLEKTLKKLGMEKKYSLMEKAGRPAKAGEIYIQFAGCTLKEAKEIIRISSTRSYIPEPVRAAHLIGAGIIKGESKGRV